MQSHWACLDLMYTGSSSWEDDEVWYSHSVRREFTSTFFSRKQIIGDRKKRKFKWKDSGGKQLTSAISDWTEKSSNCRIQRDKQLFLAEKIVSLSANTGLPNHRWCDCLNLQWGRWPSPPVSEPIYGRLLGERPVHSKKDWCPFSGQLHCKKSFSSPRPAVLAQPPERLRGGQASEWHSCCCSLTWRAPQGFLCQASLA